MEPNNRVLIVYATWHGQTERIAEHIAKVARDRGYIAGIMPAGRARNSDVVSEYGRIIVCSGVHSLRHHRDAERFVRRFRDVLAARDTAFVSVSLSAAAPEGTPDRHGIEAVVRSLSRRTQWRPGHTIYAGGCLAYTKYSLPVRWLMKRIATGKGGPADMSRDYEMTDWSKLAQDLSGILPVSAQTLHPMPDEARQLRADIEEAHAEGRPA